MIDGDQRLYDVSPHRHMNNDSQGSQRGGSGALNWEGSLMSHDEFQKMHNVPCP